MNGYQVEIPDYWLKNGNPFEIERMEVQYNVCFYGRTEKIGEKARWIPGETVVA